MNKQQLSERIAGLYSVPASIKPFRTHHLFDTVPVLLIDDTARMFELAVENDVYYQQYHKGVMGLFDELPLNDECYEVYTDHATKLEATLYAIGMALVKKAEI